MKTCPILLAAVIAFPAIADAGPAADAVKHIYMNELGMEAAPDNRDLFTGPAKAYLDANDDADCLDFGLAVDGQDFDAGEVARTLEIEESVSGEDVLVAARFSLFGEPRAIEWTMVKEGREWKVSDIAGLDAGWRLSDLACR